MVRDVYRDDRDEGGVSFLDAESASTKLEQLIKQDPKNTKSEIRNTLRDFVAYVLDILEKPKKKFRLGSYGDFYSRDAFASSHSKLETWVSVYYGSEEKPNTIELNCTCKCFYDMEKRITGYKLTFEIIGLGGYKLKLKDNLTEVEQELTKYLGSL